MSKTLKKNSRQMGKAIILGILVTVFVDILLVTGIVIVWLMICFNLGK